MPIYEYRCAKCGNEFEMVTFGMTEKVTASCPKCKSRKTSKLMSSFGRGKYGSLAAGGSFSSGMSGGSGCSSCSSSNCSSCGH